MCTIIKYTRRQKLGLKTKRFFKNLQLIKEIKENFELKKPYFAYDFGLKNKLICKALRVGKFTSIFEKIIFFDKLLFTKFKKNNWNFKTLRYLTNSMTSLTENEIVSKNMPKILGKTLNKGLLTNYKDLNITRRAG